MRKAITREEILAELHDLAFCKTNDAVKLAFLGENKKDVGRLDLRCLAGLHVSGNGGTELKFIDRARLIELLLAATEERPDPGAAAAGLIGAINGAADKLGAAREAGDGTLDLP